MPLSKQDLSKVKVETSVGFIYWLAEDRTMRGLKTTNFEEFPQKIEQLEKEYLKKYPDGLTGWS